MKDEKKISSRSSWRKRFVQEIIAFYMAILRPLLAIIDNLELPGSVTHPPPLLWCPAAVENYIVLILLYYFDGLTAFCEMISPVIRFVCLNLLLSVGVSITKIGKSTIRRIKQKTKKKNKNKTDTLMSVTFSVSNARWVRRLLQLSTGKLQIKFIHDINFPSRIIGRQILNNQLYWGLCHA